MPENPDLIQVDEAVPAPLYPALNCTIPAASFICFKSNQRFKLELYLQMLAQHKPPDSGKVDYVKPLNIAYIDENIQLISSLSGLSNLKLAAEYHQLGSSQQISKRAEELLVQFNCLSVSHKLPAFMTNLEKRLLLIARSLMLTPTILLIEKPFQGLEVNEVTLLGNHLISLAVDSKITIISTSMTLDFIKKAAQKIIFFYDREIYLYNEWDDFKKNHNELFDAL